MRTLDHTAFPKYFESGLITRKQVEYSYIVCEYVSGESLGRRLWRDETIDKLDLIQCCLDVLDALIYLHNLPIPVYHNAIEPDNIILDLSAGSIRGRLCGLRYATQSGQDTETLSYNENRLYYVSNQVLERSPCPESDLFSLGAVMYRSLTGMEPWSQDLLQDEADLPPNFKIIKARQKPLHMPERIDDSTWPSQGLMKIIKRALSNDSRLRFHTAHEFYNALQDEKSRIVTNYGNANTANSGMLSTPKTDGGGFSQVAGMQALKDLLINEVLIILNDLEGAKRYGISIPNGVLLYGPPGCGKTFIAERFAEEAHYNYSFIRSSDLASIYIHGSQQKIGALFNEARQKKPSIICFDELDALVQNRNDINNASMAGEVNEFLSQLNNCGKDGILVIGTTNRPDLIDPAILRKGRIDKMIYVPPPDFEARMGLFKIMLENKPIEEGIDIEQLAQITEGRVCSDIDFIVSEAARSAYHNKDKISMRLLQDIITRTGSSLTKEQTDFYENIHKNYEGMISGKKPKVGFTL
jgi:transitional endoplasmic reticulum ATPase